MREFIRGKSRLLTRVVGSAVMIAVFGACIDGNQELLAPDHESALSRAGGVTTVHISERLPFGPTIYNSCVDELVDFAGSLNLTWHMTFDAEGNLLHEKFHANPQGVAGTGRTSGAAYRLAGAENNSYMTKASGAWQVPFVGVMRVIGPGRGNSFHLHFQYFAKVDASGGFSAHLDNSSAECR